MFSKKIILIFIIYIISCTIVQADNLNNNYQYVPKKGYMVDIKKFRNETIRENIFKELEEQKSQKEKDNIHFKTFNMKIPKYWKKQWKDNKDAKYNKYKKDDIMEVPNPKHNETVYQLMVMSRNAYVPPDSNDWVDLTDFGWKIVRILYIYIYYKNYNTIYLFTYFNIYIYIYIFSYYHLVGMMIQKKEQQIV